ncbi:RNA helicase [Agyrium rufum]|nr:RNA helicase [Agyrium rufum]
MKVKGSFDRCLGQVSLPKQPAWRLPPSRVCTAETGTSLDRRHYSDQAAVQSLLRLQMNDVRGDKVFKQMNRAALDDIQNSAGLIGRGISPITLRSGIADKLLADIVFDLAKRMKSFLGQSRYRSNIGMTDMDEEARLKRHDEFLGWLKAGLKKDGKQPTPQDEDFLRTPPSVEHFRENYAKEGIPGVNAQLKYFYQAFNANYNFSKKDILNQALVADLRYPMEWYPEARQIRRKIHLHVGPTNSGKTYQALKRLEEAKTGVYAGPLRLLAYEVYNRLNKAGRPCHLLTGDEQIFVEPAKEGEPVLHSCTVEMIPVNQQMDVAVIDEIQMMADPSRGWAWTAAVMGVRAKEVHLCGELRTVQIVKELAAAMGDSLEIHRYERLNPLKVMRRSLGGRMENLRKGDAIVSFSRVGLHAMKKAVEEATGRRAAIIYGSLPPEIRAQQAKLFNDPDNDYDFLVASDAIGMGLNLSIKRIIFEKTHKFNGTDHVRLDVSQIKQIAGRAGRFKTADETKMKVEVDDPVLDVGLPPASSTNVEAGFVTSFDDEDLGRIHKAMSQEAPQIDRIGVLPPETVFIRFANYFPPETPFSYVVLRLYEFARTHPRFFLCSNDDQLAAAEAIQSVPNLSISDRLVFCAAPASGEKERDQRILKTLATAVANQKRVDILDIEAFSPDVLDEPVTADKDYLRSLEALHRCLVIYIWLSYRFDSIFHQRPLAFHIKTLVEKNVDKVLTEFTSVLRVRQRLSKIQSRRKQQENSLLELARLAGKGKRPEMQEMIERDVSILSKAMDRSGRQVAQATAAG